MRNRHRLLPLALLAVLCAAPRAARADTTVGADATTGDGYRGFDLRGSADLDAKKTWEGDLGYAYAHSKTGTESRSNQFSLGAYHDLDAGWTAHGALTHWRDSLNAVAYTGPSFGAAYTARAAGEDGPGAELWRVSVDADLFFYKADATVAGRTIMLPHRVIHVPPRSASIGLTQFRPTVSAERPLFDDRLVPWVTLGHSFYSKDPTALEERVGRPRFAAMASTVNGLVGGLLRTTALAGVDLRLPRHSRLTASLGAQRLATDNTWATTQGLSAKVGATDALDVSAAWNRTIQDGAALDLYTAGLAYYF